MRLEFDLFVEIGFYYLARWPIALIDVIGEKKAQMFAALQPNPLEPELMIVTGTFKVEGSVYKVTFGTDPEGYHDGVLRVMHIEP